MLLFCPLLESLYMFLAFGTWPVFTLFLKFSALSCLVIDKPASVWQLAGDVKDQDRVHSWFDWALKFFYPTSASGGIGVPLPLYCWNCTKSLFKCVFNRGWFELKVSVPQRDSSKDSWKQLKTVYFPSVSRTSWSKRDNWEGLTRCFDLWNSKIEQAALICIGRVLYSNAKRSCWVKVGDSGLWPEVLFRSTRVLSILQFVALVYSVKSYSLIITIYLKMGRSKERVVKKPQSKISFFTIFLF